MTESVVFYFVHPPGDGWPLHTARRENIPNSTQNERYVCVRKQSRMLLSVVWLNNCSTVDFHSRVRLSVFYSVFSPNRTENADGQEFLSGADEKKTTRFTDVSSCTGPACVHAFLGCNMFPVSIDCSLRAKPHLACLSLTWATPLWAVGSWDWRTPWPTRGSSCFCKFLEFLEFLLIKNESACEDF